MTDNEKLEAHLNAQEREFQRDVKQRQREADLLLCIYGFLGLSGLIAWAMWIAKGLRLIWEWTR